MNRIGRDFMKRDSGVRDKIGGYYPLSWYSGGGKGGGLFR